MPPIHVRLEPDGDGWKAEVEVSERGDTTFHTVRLTRQDLDRYAGSAKAEPDVLVKRSFEFLLERERKESILSTFELPLIQTYFPEYPVEIRKRMTSPRK